jgi:hypothetical protein
MSTTTHERLLLSSEKLTVLAELLETARARRLIEIRQTHHRTFRDEVRHRLTLVDALVERCR